MQNMNSQEFICQEIPFLEKYEKPMNGGRTSAVKRRAGPGEEPPRKRARNFFSTDLEMMNKRTSGSHDLDQVTGQPTNPSLIRSDTLPENGGRTRAVKRSASPGEEPPRKKARTCFSASWEAVKTQNRGGEGEFKDKSTRASLDSELSSCPLVIATSSGGDLSQTGTNRKATSDDERLSRESGSELHETKTESSVDDKFEDKYEEQLKLGEGNYGSVFAGYRKSDHMPVAIKHMKKDSVMLTYVYENGETVPAEVAIMQELSQGGSLGNSASVALFDWYELDQEIILVMERPVPCIDLFGYLCEKGYNLQEEEAKVIIKQLLDGLKVLLDNGIFHQDIKLENILIDTSSDVPRVRIIDFGLSCFFEEGAYFIDFRGTRMHAPAEFLTRGMYEPGPATVWQLGVVLFELLHLDTRFYSVLFCQGLQTIESQMSENCFDFLCQCLDLLSDYRPTLEDLQLHPWLN